MALKLPLSDKTGLAGFSFTITLEGDDFILDFRYNDRDERYYLTIKDEDEQVIASSIKVVRGPLLRTISDERRPWGELFVKDTGANAEPTLSNIGNGIDIYFISVFEDLQ